MENILDAHPLNIPDKYYSMLDIEGFLLMLKDPHASYKYFWLEAIVCLISDGYTEATYDEIIDEMISNAWFPVQKYDIRLTKPNVNGEIWDNLEKAVWQLRGGNSKLESLSINASKAKIKERIKLFDESLHNVKIKLTLYVPYRALSGFANKGEDKIDLNSKTEQLVEYYNRINDTSTVLPYTFGEGSGLYRRLKFNEPWIQMIRANTKEILDWIQWNKVSWFKKNNPEPLKQEYLDKLQPTLAFHSGTGSVESDMQTYKDDSSYEARIFADFPLLGSKIFTSHELKSLESNTKIFLDKIQSEGSMLSLQAKMQVTLSIINFAKNWDYETSPKFWEYIMLQYGYRNPTQLLISKIQKIVEDALKKNHRFFFENAKGREFKTSIMFHAISPRKSWMALFDFLFDFFRDNLKWNFVPGDPILDLMVQALQRKLSGSNQEEMRITVRSQSYHFQEGIQKLILCRPAFTRELFERLIGRIAALINAEAPPVSVYEEQLCDEWFKLKITEISDSKSREHKRKSSQREVAIDYSQIKFKLVLKDEDDIQLAFPDIRLKKEVKTQALLTIYYGDSEVLQKSVNWWGNELGETLMGDSVSLPAFPEGLRCFDMHVRITCDGEKIADSHILPNDPVVLFFPSANEVSASSLKQGKYTAVVPCAADVKFENAECTEIYPFKVPGLKAYFIELNKEFAVFADGKLLSFDHDSNAEIQVIPQEEFSALPEVIGKQATFRFARVNSECFFNMKDEKTQQFLIMKNGNQLNLHELPKQTTEAGTVYICKLSGEQNICQIHVLDLGKNKLIYDMSFFLINHGECSFNRDFYFVADDWEKAELKIQIDEMVKRVSFSMTEDEIELPFHDGIMRVKVPKIVVEETTGSWLNGTAPAWYIGNIPLDSFIKVINPPGTQVQFFVGEEDIQYDGKGLVTIGNVLQSYADRKDLESVDLNMEVRGSRESQTYCLAEIYLHERFLRTPEFWSRDGQLFWDHGGMFIGKTGRKFHLTLYENPENQMEFELYEQTESLPLPDGMKDGKYKFKISILSAGLFSKTCEQISQGECRLGDPNVLRFLDRRVVIDSITDEDKTEESHISIKSCCIDQIQFEGVQNTSEGNCPVYSGILFTEDPVEGRKEFSYETKVSNWLVVNYVKVNPVRIVYVGEGSLCITDSDGDGLYYRKQVDPSSKQEFYEITDKEYTQKNRDQYSIADLYSYKIE